MNSLRLLLCLVLLSVSTIAIAQSDAVPFPDLI